MDRARVSNRCPTSSMIDSEKKNQDGMYLITRAIGDKIGSQTKYTPLL